MILAETALAAELAPALSGMESPLVRDVESLQLGEDLLVQVKMPRGAARRVRDALPPDARRAARPLCLLRRSDPGRRRCGQRAARTRGAGAHQLVRYARVARVPSTTALREQLDRRGTVAGPGAARRLHGSVPPCSDEASRGGFAGRAYRDGSMARASPGSPLELAAAMSQAAQAKGYLALLARVRARDRNAGQSPGHAARAHRPREQLGGVRRGAGRSGATRGQLPRRFCGRLRRRSPRALTRRSPEPLVPSSPGRNGPARASPRARHREPR